MVLGIFGANRLGREVLELARIINGRKKRWEDIFFIVDIPASETNGAAVYSYEEAIERFKGRLEITIAVGELADRKMLIEKTRKDGIEAATLIHPDVHIPESTLIGKGVTIQMGCFISCNSIIEDYVYIQPITGIGHDNVIHEGCMIGGGISFGGDIELGRYVYVGMHSTIKEHVKVGAHSIIGMCSAVYKDIPDEVIAMGNPARPMKRNEESRVYKWKNEEVINEI